MRFHFSSGAIWARGQYGESIYPRSDWVSLRVRERKEVGKKSAAKGLNAAMQIIPVDYPV